jgi:DNA-directed RNA polymerase specialized sigma24 family protein
MPGAGAPAPGQCHRLSYSPPSVPADGAGGSDPGGPGGPGALRSPLQGRRAPAPYLRRCITGALQHHLRDRVRLVRIPHRLHEQGQCPLGHLSLDATADGEPCLLDQLVEQLPAAQATALRLTVLEGLSLRAAAERLQISAMSVSHREVRLAAQRAQKKAIAALRQQLAGGG